eukprot:TRINITY_DN14857_c0_g1_i2.p1 TRINITY_DN14857_c0_g1~~TRINITY_DN14857_c0_g1_i2.p1  ORF type:complete len:768 (+),score=204.95 TRINITY_DN14857_c0_g1_i2:110-2305(+)
MAAPQPGQMSPGQMSPGGGREPLPSPMPLALRDEKAQELWRSGSARLSRRGSTIIADDSGRGAGVSTLDYLISLMGYAIGIGNVWRFPYLVGKWGGFSFLIAYVFCLVMVACPLYLFELALGQDTRKSTIHCFRAVRPRWAGLGWCTCVMLFFVLGYYNMLLAYSLVYMYYSFTTPLPWTGDALPPNLLPAGTTPSEHFWQNTVLNRFDPDEFNAGDTSGTGPVQGHLVLALAIVWIFVFLALFKGLEASAKVSYVTVGLPVVLILVMLVRAVNLDGAGDGVKFYVGKFDGSVFGDPQMWSIACGQILFSLSPGMGTAVTLSSYTRPKEDVYKVNLAVSICNSSFSITGGFAVFSILGFMSYTSCNTPGMDCRQVDDLAKAGTGLAFVTLAEGVSQFGDGSNVFALFFFIMLLTLGLDSTFAWVETFNTYIKDMLDHAGYGNSQYAKREFIAGASALGLFLCGLPYCTRFGIFLLDVIDHFVASYILIIVCFFELFMLHIDWKWSTIVYGLKRATRGINPRSPHGRNIPRYWGIVLLYCTGPILLFLFVYLLQSDFRTVYEGYPGWMQAIGWVALVLCILPFPFCFFKDFSQPGDPNVGSRGRMARAEGHQSKAFESFQGMRGVDEPLLNGQMQPQPQPPQQMPPGYSQQQPQTASPQQPHAPSPSSPPQAGTYATPPLYPPQQQAPANPLQYSPPATEKAPCPLKKQNPHVSHFIGDGVQTLSTSPTSPV